MNTRTNYPWLPPPERGTGRAFLLAALMHLLLLALLVYGLHWQSSTPAGVEAELWSELPELTPTPPQSAATPQQPTPAATPQPQTGKADIALEQTKRRQQQLEAQQKLAQQEQLKKQQQLAEKQRQERLTQEKKRQEKKQQEQVRLKQQLAQQKIEQQKKLKQQAAQAKEQAERQHQARLATLKNLAAKNTASQGSAVASKGNGAGGQGSPGYANKVRQRVKPNIIFEASHVAGNPRTVVSVQCAPDGAILSVSLSQSSGNAAWDEAVLRAVQKSDPMPRDTDGKVPRHFIMTFQPKD